jgi:hypothetical protein
MAEQVSTGPRSPEYILSRLQVFFPLGIIILRWRVLCFHCSCMMISEIVAELISSLCYLPSELCAIEGVNEEMYLFIHLDYDHSVMYLAQ